MQFYDSGEYRASKKWPYAISAGCVVYRPQEETTEVLLLCREPHTTSWDGDTVTYHLPKGHAKINESLTDAAVRETQEETGNKVELITYLGALHHIFTDPRSGILN